MVPILNAFRDVVMFEATVNSIGVYKAVILAASSLMIIPIPIRRSALILLNSGSHISCARRLQASYSTMPSSNPEARNASGLTPTESKALKERSVEPHETKVIQSIKEV